MLKLFHVAATYRKHKASGQANVTINGQNPYLGPWGSKASRREYDRLIAEWLARGRVTPQSGPDSSLSVMELLKAYLRWATRTGHVPAGLPLSWGRASQGLCRLFRIWVFGHKRIGGVPRPLNIYNAAATLLRSGALRFREPRG